MNFVHDLDSDRQITFRLLEYLRVMVAERHVTRASERLGVSQPKMSSALARLRKITGDPLLVRTPAGMAPTRLAVELAEHSDSFLERWKELLGSHTVFLPSQSGQKFRIYAPSPASISLVAKAIARVRSIAPGIAVSITTGSSRPAHELLEADDIDLAIGWNPDLPAGIMISQLGNLASCCIAAEDHPRVRDGLDLSGYLEEFHIVSMSSQGRTPNRFERRMDRALSSIGMSRKIAIHSSSQWPVPQIVAETELLAVVGRRQAELVATSVRLRLFDLPIEVPPCELALIWHPRTTKDAGNKWFRSILRELARDL